ncbi:hypothetical protein NDU88_003416 [Pleurodeles waltl]|uniref:Uncharacterized protein n=1 Tax=Pleurodeles waltl TaxID=8319 RepID=A0AAV7TPP4_PLEWA|nr:hypothetical protein NDU88_003416 [Pleurodeles waltl]
MTSRQAAASRDGPARRKEKGGSGFERLVERCVPRWRFASGPHLQPATPLPPCSLTQPPLIPPPPQRVLRRYGVRRRAVTRIAHTPTKEQGPKQRQQAQHRELNRPVLSLSAMSDVTGGHLVQTRKQKGGGEREETATAELRRRANRE